MSRIGRLPITVPAGVTVEIAENNKVTYRLPPTLKFSERLSITALFSVAFNYHTKQRTSPPI